MMYKQKNILLTLLLALFSASCTNHTDDENMNLPIKRIDIRIAPYNTTTESKETIPQEWSAYLFQDSILSHVYQGVPQTDGTIQLNLDAKDGSLYFLADGEELLTTKPETGKTRLEDFKQTNTPTNQEACPSLFLSGYMELTSDASQETLTLARGMARIDVELETDDVAIDSILMHNVANAGYLFSQKQITTSPAASLTTLYRHYKQPLVQNESHVFHLFEQSGKDIRAELYMRTKGSKQIVNAVFPTLIKRNTLYKIRVRGSGTTLSAIVTEVSDWDTGSENDTKPSNRILIDKEQTILSPQARIGEQGDTLFLPYTASDITLALTSETTTEYQVTGYADGVSVTELSSSKSTLYGNMFRITSTLRAPQSQTEYIHLDVKSPTALQTYTSTIVIVIAPNGNLFKGFETWDAKTYTCNYNRYIDGTLGIVRPSTGKQLKIEFENGEDPWITLREAENENNAYRVVAGWRPNDLTANGREQRAKLVITDSEGDNKEVYTLIRKNWGLPVVEINGLWWCKYNLRGNSRLFEDQVSIEKDPARIAGVSVADYLDTCPAEEYFGIWGDGYQGSNTTGLKLEYKNGLFQYANYASNISQNMSAPPHESHCPDGYQIPSVEDFKTVLRNGTGIFYSREQTAYTSEKGQQMIAIPHKRTDMFYNGGKFSELYHYELTSGEQSITLYGPGYQPDENSGLVNNYVIYATYTGNSNDNWLIEKKADRGEFWHVSRANKQTRIKLCIKKPVEYIY